MRVIHVLRKPLSEGTVAANTLRHGTGGINIDASRIASDGSHMVTRNPKRKQHDLSGGDRDSAGAGMFAAGSTFTPTNHEGGRWPANVILQHLDGCRCDGFKRVKATSIHGESIAVPRSGVHHTAGGHQSIGRKQPVTGHADKDGKETVANWICEPGCPVARLDEQSGVLKSGALPSTQYTEGDRDNSSMFAGDGVFTHQGYKADSGGASRFYKQVGGKSDG